MDSSSVYFLFETLPSLILVVFLWIMHTRETRLVGTEHERPILAGSQLVILITSLVIIESYRLMDIKFGQTGSTVFGLGFLLLLLAYLLPFPALKQSHALIRYGFIAYTAVLLLMMLLNSPNSYGIPFEKILPILLVKLLLILFLAGDIFRARAAHGTGSSAA